MASRTLKRRKGSTTNSPLLKKLVISSVIVGCLFVLGAGILGLLNDWFSDLPDYQSAEAFNSTMPTHVYASDRKTEIARFQMEYREPVERSQISDLLVNALIATEDARFYDHGGVDYYGVMRALVNNLTGGRLEGGSTITQQFVRNTILADEMKEISVKRKVREAYIALQLEKRYSKDEILTMYLNTINFGAGAYGAQAAAKRYFSKSAKDLTLAEAALLAGIPQSPTYNDPLQYPDHAVERRNIVLSRMLGEHYISEEEYNRACAAPLKLAPSKLHDDGILAYPYFASYVRYLLYNEYDLSEANVLKGGLNVYTTLDVDKQKDAEEACKKKKASMYNDNIEVAMAVVEPSSGNVQAIVGGSNYKESEVNLATGQGGGGRPCGSVFKMFTLVESIKERINPNSTYLDCSSPATVDGYKLENYGNTSYGTRTIAGAFAVSSNTGFVRLISSLGVNKVVKTAHDLGVTTDLKEDEAGATLTLGVQNVTPLELANAAATIANGGTHHDLCAISRIETHDGSVLIDNADPSARANRVLSEEEASAVQEVMSGVITGGTGTAAALPNGQPVAGKTGTSEDYKDISFVGFTPFMAVSIWVGDPSNTSAVPTGTAADVFRNYGSAVIAREKISVEKFLSTNKLDYKSSYEDSRYHISSGAVSYFDYGNGSKVDSDKKSDETKDNEDKTSNSEEEEKENKDSNSRSSDSSNKKEKDNSESSNNSNKKDSSKDDSKEGNNGSKKKT